LHSKERALVGDGVRAILQFERVLDITLGETDDLVRWLGWLVSRGLPLDVAARERPGLPFAQLVDLDAAVARAVAGLAPVQAVAVGGSFREEIADEIYRSLGVAAMTFVASCRDRAPVGLRASRTRGGRGAAVTALRAEGIETRPMRYAADGVEVVGKANVVGSVAYAKGLVEVQDEGSQILAETVAPDGGPMVDWCAGAGGKTLALADMAPNAPILAADVRGRALDELRRRAARSGARVEVARLDEEGRLDEAVARPWRGTASRVLVDAPCSGTGTLRRHPELRLGLTAGRVSELAALQLRILREAAPMVRPGGRLVYATCSVLAAENEDIVGRFLAERPEFSALSMERVLGAGRAKALGQGRDLRLAPHTTGTDGFYAAVLLRGSP
jgi:16S rRNA (cytosine967-C5)-methyltransferase